MHNNDKLAKIGSLVKFDDEKQKSVFGQIIGFHELEDLFIISMFNNEFRGWRYNPKVKEEHHIYDKNAKKTEDCYYVKTEKCKFV